MTRLGVRGRFLDGLAFGDERAILQEIERLGVDAVWIPESLGKEAFAHAGALLGATTTLTVATGIASIWARDAMAMANGARTLADAFPGRFVLGIGVSHAPLVEARGQRYEQPFERLSSYLDGMARAPYRAPEPATPAPVVIGALGPRMTRLAADRGLGVHPFFVPVEHTRTARAVVGDGLLAPQQAFSLAGTRSAARRDAQGYVDLHLSLFNYAANLRRLGWAADDLSGGGSDALFDALVAWGGVDAVVERVHEHVDAGADEVVLQPLVGEEAEADATLNSLDPIVAAYRGQQS